MNLSIIAFTPRGAALAKRLSLVLAGEGECCHAYAFRFFPGPGGDPILPPLKEPLAGWTQRAFEEADGIVFFSACGIAVRAVAPFLRDKRTDPAVVAVDEMGNFAVSLLSGHAGGANRLARRIGGVLGARPVVTTGTDVEGLFALDEWAVCRGWRLEDPGRVKGISAALLAGEEIRFRSDFPLAGEPPKGFSETDGEEKLWFTCSSRPGGSALKAYPAALAVGVGCRRGVSARQIEEAVAAALSEGGFSPMAVGVIATIDRKAEEPGLLEYCRRMDLPLRAYSPGELMAVQGEFSSSEFVQSVTGADNVCERSAVLACGEGGRLAVKKRAANGVTAAVALRRTALDFTLPGEGGAQ